MRIAAGSQLSKTSTSLEIAVSIAPPLVYRRAIISSERWLAFVFSHSVLAVAPDHDPMANVLLQREASPAAILLSQWLSGYAFLFGTSMNWHRAKQIRSALPAGMASGDEPLGLRAGAPGDLMKLSGGRVAVGARQASIGLDSIELTEPSSETPQSRNPAPGVHP